nr:uncharacterized protein LOC123764728 isoform X1 [Procambarus clarkii]XP_045608742.1 uncharacterized protein LOC123764728 isoform X2 [Procambarus clarkii]
MSYIVAAGRWWVWRASLVVLLALPSCMQVTHDPHTTTWSRDEHSRPHHVPETSSTHSRMPSPDSPAASRNRNTHLRHNTPETSGTQSELPSPALHAFSWNQDAHIQRHHMHETSGTQSGMSAPDLRASSWNRDAHLRRHNTPEISSTQSQMSSRRAWWEDGSGRRQSHSSPSITTHHGTSNHMTSNDPIRNNLGYSRQNTARQTSDYDRRVLHRNVSLHGHQESRRTAWHPYVSKQHNNLRTTNEDHRQPQRRVENYLKLRGQLPTAHQTSYPHRQREVQHNRGFNSLSHNGVEHTTSGSSHATSTQQHIHKHRASTHRQSNMPQHHTNPHNAQWQHQNARRDEATTASTRVPGHQYENTDEKQKKKVVYKAPRPLRSPGGHVRPPNIVLIMTDDQDVELGSLNYMPSLVSLMKDRGAHFPNAYCTTPICCPSRSSMLTGLYIHNHEVYTNNHNCSSQQWQDTHERRSFATYLSAAGYRTGYFGKYLNKYNGSHIPAGWQEWAGLIKNSRYYNYTVQRNGHFIKYGDHYPKDYYPHVITNEGIQFLEKNKALDSSPPMMMVLSYPAPHGPEDSAPEHAHRFFNATDHNTMAYNYAPNPDKQWLLQFTGRMHDIELKFTDLLMTKRLQTLQTIDESVAKVVNTLDAIGELNNTYIFYTSDHGYHLGQFGLVKGKSMPFEFDIKVPFLVRGPGIQPGRQVDNIALNVDLAPTFLDIAGIKPPSHMDGRSLLPVLTGNKEDGPEATSWRDSFLVESAGRHREEDALKLREERRQLRAQGLIGSGVNGGLYTSKRERLEIICKSEEYRSPCQEDQKWECVHEGYRWRLHKCRKGKTQGSRARWRQRNCVCEPYLGMGYLVKLDPAERRKQRTFLKKHATQAHFSTDLRDYGAKFIKVFTDVDSREILEQTLGTRIQRNSLLSHIRKLRSKRSTRENLSVDAGQSEYEGDDVDVVDTFVTEEEIRDIDVTIDSLYDELESLQSVSSTAATGIVGRNTSALAASPTDTTPVDIRHGCRVTGTSVDCTDDVYHDPHAWRLSKVAIDQQIRRLHHQLIVMKDIRKHLQDSRPDSVTDSEDYEEYVDETEASGDFSLLLGESDNEQGNDNDIKQGSDIDTEQGIDNDTLRTEDPLIFEDAYSTEDEGGYNESVFNSSHHHHEDENYASEEISGDSHYDKDGLPTEEDSIVEDGVIIIGKDYDADSDEIYDHTNNHQSHTQEGIPDEDQTVLEEAEPELTEIHKVPGKDSHQGGKQFQLFPVRAPTPHQRPASTINNETTARSKCWCDKSFRLEIKQAERQRKREERLKLRLERQRVKEERRLMKEKKKLRKLKNNLAQCNYTMLNCYTHDNDHWRTPPLWHDGKFCFCMNAANNTYWCVRTINQTHNFLYCEFVTGLVTYYDLNIDPYQLRNVAFTLTNNRLAELHHRLETLRTCSGANQCDNLPASEGRKNSSKGNIQDIEDMESDDISNRVDLIIPSRPVKSRLQQREERRRIREERDRQREARRRLRKQQKKWRRNQLFESKGRHVLQTMGSDRGIVRLRRKSRAEERRRLKKERRDRRRERKRKKDSKNDRIPLSG